MQRELELPYNIVLIGFMGVGKSRIASYFQKEFQMKIVEMDELIAEREGMSISEIFKVHGEEYFRDLETALLIELQGQTNTVISCGGGTPLRERNVQEMKKNGKVVWLTATPETIFERVKDNHDRPLLEQNKNVEFIRSLLEGREEKYRAASDFLIATDQRNVYEICDEILEKLGVEIQRQKDTKIVEVRGVHFGEGIPKVCVSIIGNTKEAILEQASNLQELGIDVIEWRADWFLDVFQWEETENVLQELRKILGNIPLIFTFRTKQEGGEQEITKETYQKLMDHVIESACVDFVDAELFMGEECVKRIEEKAHKKNIKMIASNHDFDKTPAKEEIIKRLCKMQELGADLLKIAAMPQTKKDVLILLESAVEMEEQYAKQPLIFMSMGKEGAISRLCGELFGSAITFGAAQKASAAGQIEVQKLKTLLGELHTVWS